MTGQRDFMVPGRSLAVGDRGVAAASHPAVTLAAVDILRSGGRALTRQHEATIGIGFARRNVLDMVFGCRGQVKVQLREFFRARCGEWSQGSPRLR